METRDPSKITSVSSFPIKPTQDKETDPVRLAKMKHTRWRMIQQTEAKALMQLDKAIQSGDKESAAEAKAILSDMDKMRQIGFIEKGIDAYKETYGNQK